MNPPKPAGEQPELNYTVPRKQWLKGAIKHTCPGLKYAEYYALVNEIDKEYVEYAADQIKRLAEAIGSAYRADEDVIEGNSIYPYEIIKTCLHQALEQLGKGE